MRTFLECIPCFLRQALDAARMATSDPALHEHVVRETLKLTADMRFDHPPPWMGQQIHRLLREATGNPDPYREAKARSNTLALALYPKLAEQIRLSADPFKTAVSLAIAGNIIDLGSRSEVSEGDVHQAIDDAINGSLDDTAVADLRRRVDAAREILYLADNAGEIVFDRLLIEQLPRDRVTLVVRGSPVINDATREDAEAAGLASLVSMMDTGSDVPGTILEFCSAAFRTRFGRSDLVIAKGQGNYETLSGKHAHVVYLFKAKCPVAARDVGCDVDEFVVCHDALAAGTTVTQRKETSQ